jgi:hypothetical protein
MEFKSDLASQYKSTLAMLRQAVEKCPAEMWDDPQDKNRFWRVAYHALFYTLFYAHQSLDDFDKAGPWSGHRNEYHQFPREEDPAEQDVPYTKEEILACWKFTADKVAEIIPALNLDARSGFYWYDMSKLAHQIVNLRHTQQHTGELMERLGQRAGINVDWIG